MTENSERDIVILSFNLSSKLLRPSTARYGGWEDPEKSRVIVSPASMTSGRIASSCAQIGLIMTASISGVRTGPCAEREYAVEPVGVEIITPSARN